MSCLRLFFSDLLVLGRYLCPFVFFQALVFNVRLVSFELFGNLSLIKVVIKADSHYFVSRQVFDVVFDILLLQLNKIPLFLVEDHFFFVLCETMFFRRMVLKDWS